MTSPALIQTIQMKMTLIRNNIPGCLDKPLQKGISTCGDALFVYIKSGMAGRFPTAVEKPQIRIAGSLLL